MPHIRGFSADLRVSERTLEKESRAKGVLYSRGGGAWAFHSAGGEFFLSYS